MELDLSLFGAEHVRRYRETDGADGYLWNGVPTLILTTTGRRSGQARDTPLICGFDGDVGVVIASQGGAPKHPHWYLNLLADPRVRVQVKADRYDAVARTVDGPERERLWQLMSATWPSYDVYQQRTDRVIPVVALERIPR
ncbi:nitroreductase family deazaflavin-dependent oxidoreductase [Cryptosporangium aurantiacum]|uniref:Deazaflavin-dependent oxidoreductase, nitroreductase family n=1 Tax=Cryptosporangium aurantiacum TaxID=134849 RepID=A0A1M7TYK9_9ACTN|nr:nitroreductase family deazaflavin-dependent oxidoreductase [Cryptosporangium aurantiacum]SHN75743.1 deazaflavin-dependent oxidoreductase, nitroreductase family [Cryptosporangium aurantiacum]